MNKSNSLPSVIPMPGHFPGMPVGSVIAFAGEIRKDSNDPHETNLYLFDWLECNGQKVKVAEFPELFQALGYKYGGDAGMFHLPDYQGTFLRGVGNFAGSHERRTAPKHGDTNSVGSTQDYALLSHTHKYQKTSKGITLPAETAGTLSASPLIPTDTEGPNTSRDNLSSTEIRPVNTSVYWLIKARL